MVEPEADIERLARILDQGIQLARVEDRTWIPTGRERGNSDGQVEQATDDAGGRRGDAEAVYQKNPMGKNPIFWPSPRLPLWRFLWD